MPHTPVYRRCIACRAVHDVVSLVRFAPDATQGMVTAPRSHRERSGRGHYVCADHRCMRRAAQITLGRAKLTLNADAVALQLAQQAHDERLAAAETRALGLARRGYKGHDARLRGWFDTASKLASVVEYSTTTQLGA